MAIYSDEKRPVLANWIKYTLFINVVFFIILALYWYFSAGTDAIISNLGIYAAVLFGLNIAAFLIYEQLFRPEDDGLRRAAEVLGSIQIACACIALLVILATTLMAISPGLAALLPGSSAALPASTAPVQNTVTASATEVAAQPTECYQTTRGCVPIPPAPTVPPTGKVITTGDDPIIGSFIFVKSQFDPKINYYSREGNYEYRYKSVPLDHSPDIQWTFRDDGIILFYDATNGDLLRFGSWSKSNNSAGIPEYRIKRGNYDYRGIFTDNVFRITSPDFWNMTRAP